MNITVDRALIEQALNALELGDPWSPTTLKVFKELRAALEQPEQDNGGKTGWPPGLLQDDCRGLSKWLASKPDAKRRVREALEQPKQPEQSWTPENLAAMRRLQEKQYQRDAMRQKVQQEPVAWMLKTGHGTEFKEQLTDELRALTWKGKPMWTPLYVSLPQRKPLPPQSPCEMTQAEGKMFKLGWLECEAAHGIKE